MGWGYCVHIRRDGGNGYEEWLRVARADPALRSFGSTGEDGVAATVE
jgi:hypothetical protein